MNLPIIGTVQREPYTWTADPYTQTDAWGAPVETATHGWWQPSPDEITVDPGRRADEIVRAVLVPVGMGGGDRDRWTLPDGVFLQVGKPQDANNGPFGMRVPLVVYLKTVEG